MVSKGGLDQGLSISYNWFYIIESTVNVTVSGNGTDALTEDGREIYNNFYPSFGL